MPQFQLTPDTCGIVAGICRSLDGIPLAIELAAARVATMSIEDIARRLDDPIGSLTAGGRAAPPRHQTLRASLDWSHALLQHPERKLLRRLAVFSGGFTLEAVEAVCASDDLPAASIPVLLIDWSPNRCSNPENTTRRFGSACSAWCVAMQSSSWFKRLTRLV
jgi:non-specific serine/threonine protein kinase